MLHEEESLISIIIPVYNQARELELALESIKNQTYKNVEVIIVDDGSNPELQNADFRMQNVRIIRQNNCGAPTARNRGLEFAKGEYVIFWDADIVADPKTLEILHNTLNGNQNVSFAYCNIKYLILNIFNIIKIYKTIPAQNFNLNYLRKNNFIHSTSLIRRADAIKWDENLKRFQDWDLWLTMAEQNKQGVWIDECLFTIIAKGTISSWLPSFAYQKPWKYLPFIRRKVADYERTKEIILKKHNLF